MDSGNIYETAIFAVLSQAGTCEICGIQYVGVQHSVWMILKKVWIFVLQC